jgi:predicted N-acetyltransferase YhbS
VRGPDGQGSAAAGAGAGAGSNLAVAATAAAAPIVSSVPPVSVIAPSAAEELPVARSAEEFTGSGHRPELRQWIDGHQSSDDSDDSDEEQQVAEGAGAAAAAAAAARSTTPAASGGALLPAGAATTAVHVHAAVVSASGCTEESEMEQDAHSSSSGSGGAAVAAKAWLQLRDGVRTWSTVLARLDAARWHGCTLGPVRGELTDKRGLLWLCVELLPEVVQSLRHDPAPPPPPPPLAAGAAAATSAATTTTPTLAYVRDTAVKLVPQADHAAQAAAAAAAAEAETSGVVSEELPCRRYPRYPGDQAALRQSFEIRALRSTAELEGPWLDLVHSVFSPVRIPRQYFARHWSSDETSSQNLRWVLVAVERRSGRLVATVRVFRRTIYLRGRAVVMGGLGEVSCLPCYRRRGLASALLRRALQLLAEEGVRVCALHAAAAAAGMYRRLGWRPAPMEVQLVPLSLRDDAHDARQAQLLATSMHGGRAGRRSGGSSSGSPATITAAAAAAAGQQQQQQQQQTSGLPGVGGGAGLAQVEVCELEWTSSAWPDVVKQLAPLQAAFSEQLDGTHVRSEEYWQRWVFAPAEGLDSDGTARGGLLRGWCGRDRGSGQVVAYAIFKRAGHSFSAGAEEASAASANEDSGGGGGGGGGPQPRQPMPAVHTPPDAPDAPAATCFPWDNELTLLDFASSPSLCGAPGSPGSEGWLMHLAACAARAFWPVAEGAAVTVPCLLAPQATSSGYGAAVPSGRWMYVDVHAALAGMPAALLPQQLRPDRHLVMPIDEF